MHYANQKFENQDVRLDGNSYEQCQFENCQIIYSGTGPVILNGCGFRDDCRFNLDGAAGMALHFLDVIYHGLGKGGREMVEKTFREIKRGKYANPAEPPGSLN